MHPFVGSVSVMDCKDIPSPALLEANRQLLERRQKEQGDASSSRTRPSSAVIPWDGDTSLSAVIEGLPKHLGWGSQTATEHLRRKQKRQEKTAVSTDLSWRVRPTSGSVLPKQTPIVPVLNPKKDSIKLYPDIALGMLRQGKSSAGRIWLLLRYLDKDGRGWVTVAEARQRLTRKGSDLRAVGWRQLRNLLHEGEGLYWHRDKERIWLLGAAWVANGLDVMRLTGQPVAVPVTGLVQGMMTTNAHLYASFHSGRKSGNPINRETLEKITGIPARMQRMYEAITGTGKQRNIAIGERHTAVNVETRAWTQGGAIFDFIDHHGRQGPAKRHYIAWHLPNSYTGCHDKLPKGRQRKINKRIDLVNKRARGNGAGVGRIKHVFYDGAVKAVKAHERDSEKDAYWHSETRHWKHKGLWYVHNDR